MVPIDELRAECRITGTSRDDELLQLEESALAYFETATGRHWGDSEEVTEYLIGDGHPDLWLSEEPATIPTTVSERTYPAGDATTITAADDDGYVMRGEGTVKLVRKAGLVWTLGMEYAVTYTRGYETGEEPADVRKAVRQLVAWWFERRIPVPRPGETIAEVPAHVMSIIRAHRRLRV